MSEREQEIVAVRAVGLKKSFDDVVAVDGIDLAVRAGTCLGVLGPNGAGKTTTIEMLEGLQVPDAGSIEILGLRWEDAAQEIRAAIGVQLQETDFQDRLTVFELAWACSSWAKRRETILSVASWRATPAAYLVWLTGSMLLLAPIPLSGACACQVL